MLYKTKRSLQDCNKYRGICLMNIAGKILSQVLLSRLKESQCGLFSGHSTTYMVFSRKNPSFSVPDASRTCLRRQLHFMQTWRQQCRPKAQVQEHLMYVVVPSKIVNLILRFAFYDSSEILLHSAAVEASLIFTAFVPRQRFGDCSCSNFSM